MASSSSLNPFGEAVIPRSLDNERLFAAWFQLADSGACRRLEVERSAKREREKANGRKKNNNNNRAASPCSRPRHLSLSLSLSPPLLPVAPPPPTSTLTLSSLPKPPPISTDNDGKLTGADAVAFFERSGLPRPTLAKVWTLADAGRRGFLDRRGFAKAMELIGIAQRSRLAASKNGGGEDLSAEAYAEAAARADLDPPVLEGVGGVGGAGGGGGKAATAPAAAGGGGSDDGGGFGGGSAQPSPRTTAAASAAASPSGSGAPSPQQQQQQYAYARASQQQGQGNGRPLGGRGSSQQQQPSMKTITGVVDGLKQIYFSKGACGRLSPFLFFCCVLF